MPTSPGGLGCDVRSEDGPKDKGSNENEEINKNHGSPRDGAQEDVRLGR